VGSIPLKPLARTTSADMLEAFHVNTLGAFSAVRLAADPLRSGAGAVVLFSSIAARQGFVNHAAIAAAKGGVEGLTVALAAELAPAVRVNAIAPSLTDTPLAKPLTGNAKVLEGIAQMHPIPRIGSADEMAALAAFLLSVEAGWISGHIIAVDGGRSSLRVGRS
jgi:NAD(P)-dependent dehydrogenase (short-subunit alcohol dehydrogenase family)